MMIKTKPAVWLVLLMLSTLLPAEGATESKNSAQRAKSAAEAPPSLEPKAMEILKAACDRLATARTLSFTAVETFESPSRQGHPLVYANEYKVTLQRPDKLRVLTVADGPASEFYYEGKTITAYSPEKNLVAVADAPPTIDEALRQAFQTAAIYFPFTDIIVADPYKDFAAGLKLAYYVGRSQVLGGTTTDIVTVIGNGLFAEIWIGADNKLPLGIHAVYLDDPAQLRHNLFLSNWQVDSAVSADTFRSSKAASAKHIDFAQPDVGGPPPGRRAPAMAQPSNAR